MENPDFSYLRPYKVEYFYKYRSLKSRGLERVFNNREIFLANPRTFNDPFESRPNVTVHSSSIKKELFFKQAIRRNFPNSDRKQKREILSKSRRAAARDKEYYHKAFDEVIKGFGVYCLSEKREDILMWSHYADAHYGLCLEFNAWPGSLFWEAYKVSYQRGYPIVNVMDIGNPEALRLIVLTKSVHWEYEQEWRIVQLEYDRGSGYRSFSPDLLTGVILGALMEDADKNTVLTGLSIIQLKSRHIKPSSTKQNMN
jgi:hypothetical protein